MSHPVLVLAATLLALGLTACSSNTESGDDAGGGEGLGEHAGGGGEGGHMEGNVEGGEGGGGEESGAQFGKAETFDMVRNGARLVLIYNPASRAFEGIVTNTTGAALNSVRVEVHLSNGTELGPTQPIDLAPGQSLQVVLDAAGEDFTTYGAHPEVGGPPSGDTFSEAPFMPSLDAWARVDGSLIGVENSSYDLRAWSARTDDGWTLRLSAPDPRHQPTGAATWRGEWAGTAARSPALITGAATVTVALDPEAEANLALENVPMHGTLAWSGMAVSDGRFHGPTTSRSKTYEAVGQFGGPGQDGVVGFAFGPDLVAVFYGEKN